MTNIPKQKRIDRANRNAVVFGLVTVGIIISVILFETKLIRFPDTDMGDSLFQFFFIGIPVIFVITYIGVIFIKSYVENRKLMEKIKALGYRYIKKPEQKKYNFELLNRGHRGKRYNLIQTPEMEIFLYEYNPYSQTHLYLTVSIPEYSVNIPDGIIKRNEEDSETNEEFYKFYIIKGENKEEIKRLVNKGLKELLIEDPNWEIEIKQNKMAIISERRVNSDNLEEHVAAINNIANLLNNKNW